MSQDLIFAGATRRAGPRSARTSGWGHGPTPPESTKNSLHQRLSAHARTRWPQLLDLHVRHRGGFAYITARLPDEEDPLPLCRLRYTGSASSWGFAIYEASSDRYEDSYLPTGAPVGTPEQALDTACGLYLGDPTAWITDQPPQD